MTRIVNFVILNKRYIAAVGIYIATVGIYIAAVGI